MKPGYCSQRSPPRVAANAWAQQTTLRISRRRTPDVMRRSRRYQKRNPNVKFDVESACYVGSTAAIMATCVLARFGARLILIDVIRPRSGPRRAGERSTLPLGCKAKVLRRISCERRANSLAASDPLPYFADAQFCITQVLLENTSVRAKTGRAMKRRRSSDAKDPKLASSLEAGPIEGPCVPISCPCGMGGPRGGKITSTAAARQPFPAVGRLKRPRVAQAHPDIPTTNPHRFQAGDVSSRRPGATCGTVSRTMPIRR